MHRLSTVIVAALAVLLLTASSVQAAPIEWQWVGSPAEEPVITSIAYGAGRFVMTADGTMRTSTDGLNWTDVPLDLGFYRSFSVFYTGKEFAAVACQVRCSELLTSTNGLNWDTRFRRNGTSPLNNIAYGNQRYVLTVTGAWPMWSTDLVNWTEVNAPISTVTFGQGLFVGATSEWALVTSPDGAAWTEVFHPDEPIFLYDLAYGDGMFVAVGETGDTGNPKQAVVLTSPDAKKWTLQKLEAASDLQQVAYGNDLFVASGRNTLAVSTDGTSWEVSQNPTGQALRGLAYGAGRFVGVGYAQEPVLVADMCGTKFTDVPAGTPWCDAVEDLALQDIIKGLGPRTFGPDEELKRAELTTLLVRTLGAVPAPDQPLPFSDTADHWAAQQGYLQAALALDLIAGFPDGTFRPDDPVTRAQITKLVAAAAGLVPEGQPPYQDVPGGAWYAGWVNASHQSGLIGLHAPFALWSESTFGEDAPITRAEAAMLLANLVRLQASE